MTLDESVHGMRLRVIERAQVVGNVSAVCRSWVSRARSSIAGANGWNATAATGCIRVGCSRRRAVR